MLALEAYIGSQRYVRNCMGGNGGYHLTLLPPAQACAIRAGVPLLFLWDCCIVLQLLPWPPPFFLLLQEVARALLAGGFGPAWGAWCASPLPASRLRGSGGSGLFCGLEYRLVRTAESTCGRMPAGAGGVATWL